MRAVRSVMDRPSQTCILRLNQIDFKARSGGIIVNGLEHDLVLGKNHEVCTPRKSTNQLLLFRYFIDSMRDLYSFHRIRWYCSVVKKITKERIITMNFTRNIGMLLLAIFLILWGLSALVPIGGLGVILAILAIAAGIFILIGR